MNIRLAYNRCLAVVSACVLLVNLAVAQGGRTASLDEGFRLLYNLNFSDAQREFKAYGLRDPADPLGPSAEAAGFLFEELNRLGILEAQFFVNDSSFKNHSKLNPDPELRRFDQALTRAATLAHARLGQNPKDTHALLSLTLVSGLQADYTALIEKRNVAALHFTSDATESAHALLAVCPGCYDAYVATGISDYLIGSVAAPFRWMLRLGGYNGDKQRGIDQLQLAAAHGHYLAPFARILLAIAYMREKQPERARQLISELRQQYPGNPVFARELAQLDSKQYARK